MLDEYHCPRNVREMENTIERALVLVRDGIVTEAEIPATRAVGQNWRAGDGPGTPC